MANKSPMVEYMDAEPEVDLGMIIGEKFANEEENTCVGC